MVKITVTEDGIVREFDNARDAAAFVYHLCLNCAVPLSMAAGLFCRACYRTLSLDDKHLMAKVMRGKMIGSSE